MMADAVSRTVFLKNLGRISYGKAFNIQKEFVRGHLDCLKLSKQNLSRNTLIVCEHHPVYTVGIQNKKDAKFYLSEKQRLIRLGADFEFTNRGGLITFHGPGQLVCYPILNLAYFSKSMKWYVAQLEKTLIETCRKFTLNASTTEDTGVWIGDKKIGAIGVHAKRWITSHGVALNCNTDLRWFNHIIPCGIIGKEVTSLSQETNTDIGVSQAITPFLESFQTVFDCQVVQEDPETDLYKDGTRHKEAIDNRSF